MSKDSWCVNVWSILSKTLKKILVPLSTGAQNGTGRAVFALKISVFGQIIKIDAIWATIDHTNFVCT